MGGGPNQSRTRFRAVTDKDIEERTGRRSTDPTDLPSDPGVPVESVRRSHLRLVPPPLPHSNTEKCEVPNDFGELIDRQVILFGLRVGGAKEVTWGVHRMLRLTPQLIDRFPDGTYFMVLDGTGTVVRKGEEGFESSDNLGFYLGPKRAAGDIREEIENGEIELRYDAPPIHEDHEFDVEDLD
jgi:hypothetical protein